MARSTSIGGVFAELTLRDLKFRNSLKTARASLNSFGKGAVSALTGTVGKIAGAAGFAGIGATIAASIGKAADMEMLETQFEVLTGSMSESQKMLAALRKEATSSPLGFNDFAKAGQTLIGFGLEQEKVIDTTKMLSEVSMGNADRFQSLSLAYAQVRAAGRLMGQDTLQFINAGFNPLKQISDKTGESMATLKQRMEDGAISFSDVEQAFKDATSAGGLFYGMNEKASQTFSGKVARMKDGWDQLLISMGTPIIDELKPVLEMVNGYDFSALGANIGSTLASGLQLLTSGHAWEMFQLHAEKALANIAMSDQMNGFNAWVNTITSALDPRRWVNGGDGHTFDEYFKAGKQANLERDNEMQDKIDALNYKIAREAEHRSAPLFGTEKSEGGSKISPKVTIETPKAIDIPSVSAAIPSLLDRVTQDDYQSRGLSLSKESASKTEDKQLTVLEQVRDILKSASTSGGLAWT